MGSRVFQERALKAQIPIEVFTGVITMMNHFALGRTEDLRKWFRLINSITGLQLISPFQKLRERQVFTNHVLQKYVGVKEGKQMVLFLDMQVRFGIETDEMFINQKGNSHYSPFFGNFNKLKNDLNIYT